MGLSRPAVIGFVAVNGDDRTLTGGLRRSMGYQPSLDGLRALSVIGVLLYHGGFSWMNGGFLGVEVFFVVSGFLITSLLISERELSDRIDFREFWIRRARRLLPALFAMLIAVLVWASFFGTERQVSDLRRDVPWAVLYAGNWGQILGGVPYFGSDPLLKHVWSLAVEEQWYIVWPVLFVALTSLRWGYARIATMLFVASLSVMGFTFWLSLGDGPLLGGPPGLFDGLDRTNFMYLSTITRSSGLLLGAAAAFVWRPWRSRNPQDAPVGRILDPLGAAALAALGCAFVVTGLTANSTYQWVLPLTSLLSVIAVMCAVHPAAAGFRTVLSWQPLVEVGKRSYGLYLWSWPIFVIGDALAGDVVAFIRAMAISIVVAEVSYRLIETPLRKGLIGRVWNSPQRPRLAAPFTGGAVVIAALAVFYVNVDQFDAFEGGEDAAFDIAVLADGTDAAILDVDPVPEVTAPSVLAEETVVEEVVTTTTEPIPDLPIVAVVGDSQAHALSQNTPDGLEQVFGEVRNGSVDGCSVWGSGKVASSVAFDNDFAVCAGWEEKWAQAADGADVALVVIGAWDVFDVQDGDSYYTFGTSLHDQKFAGNLISGIDAVLDTGTDVAILEVPCMRPVTVAGAGVRALPERGDDQRIARVNQTIRWVSAQYGPEVRVFDGPSEWCNDEDIATDLGYRWDGVHVYKPGGKLIFEQIAAELLAVTER